MRLATYNVEWFAQLFSRDNRLLEDDAWSGRRDITRARQAAALGTVFNALDADAVMVIEAPNEGHRQSTVAQLETFAARFGLRTRRAVIGFGNETRQEIALLYDPDVMEVIHDPQESADAPRFDQELRIDLDIDERPELVRWSKPPLELAVLPRAGEPFRMIGVHAKSKAPHGARSRDEIIRLGIENRRKQHAQLVWLRRRIDAHLDRGEEVVVLGDFNDGPGLDEYEKLFGRSGIEIVLGADLPPDRRLHDPHALRLIRPREIAPSTARFFNAETGLWLNALLDYILLSPGLVARGAPRWRIWHPFDTPDCFGDPDLREALLAASDHFPVSVDLDLAGNLPPQG